MWRRPPSIGAASVRIQGKKGRYTRFLSDGSAVWRTGRRAGMLQIRLSDLGQVEASRAWRRHSNGAAPLAASST